VCQKLDFFTYVAKIYPSSLLPLDLQTQSDFSAPVSLGLVFQPERVPSESGFLCLSRFLLRCLQIERSALISCQSVLCRRRPDDPILVPVVGSDLQHHSAPQALPFVFVSFTTVLSALAFFFQLHCAASFHWLPQHVSAPRHFIRLLFPLQVRSSSFIFRFLQLALFSFGFPVMCNSWWICWAWALSCLVRTATNLVIWFQWLSSWGKSPCFAWGLVFWLSLLLWNQLVLPVEP
jgi:hypothetical protein